MYALPKYTQDQLQAARNYAAEGSWCCMENALNDDNYFASHITWSEKQKYARRERRWAMEVEAGLRDHNFSVWQRMNYYLTGECIALLPK